MTCRKNSRAWRRCTGVCSSQKAFSSASFAESASEQTEKTVLSILRPGIMAQFYPNRTQAVQQPTLFRTPPFGAVQPLTVTPLPEKGMRHAGTETRGIKWAQEGCGDADHRSFGQGGAHH